MLPYSGEIAQLGGPGHQRRGGLKDGGEEIKRLKRVGEDKRGERVKEVGRREGK